MMAAVTSSVFMGPPFCGSPFSLAHLAHRAQSPAATSNHPNPYSDHQAGLPMAVPHREPPKIATAATPNTRGAPAPAQRTPPRSAPRGRSPCREDVNLLLDAGPVRDSGACG